MPTRGLYDSHPAHFRGCIEVEVLDADGVELPGWSGENRARFSGNTHSRCRVDGGVVRWPGAVSLDTLKGRNIRLRFRLDWSRLFTFQAD